MDAREYFRIVSVLDNVLHVEAKGFWSDKVVEEIFEECFTQLRKAVAKASLQGRFIILADYSRLEALPASAKKVLARAMAYVKSHGLHQTVQILPRTITLMGVRDAAKLTGSDERRIVVKSMAEAKKTIEQLQKEL